MDTDDEKGQEPMAPRSSTTGTQLAIRIPKELLDRIDAHVERLCREIPGLDLTRTDAVKSLLTRALDDIEATEKRRKS
jgi:hypothetical protein